MIIKKALLESELKKVESFLTGFDLSLDKDIVETYYLEVDEKIIATISRSDYIIKALAVDELYQGQNIASKLVTEVINSLAQEKKYYYQVFTKKRYLPIFINMNFKEIASNDSVAILEGGSSNINDELNKIRKQIEFKFAINLNNTNVGAIVVNCNPITNGHLQLIEYASSKHDYFIVFVLEEDKSYFTYKERLALVYLAVNHLSNVIVIPSTKYIVSNLTFPSYFLKTMDEKDEAHAKLDAIIFKQHFMKALNINKRYIGTETDHVMVRYNDILKQTLGDNLEIIPRFQYNNHIISASLVRKYISEGKIEEALELVPNATRMLLRGIVSETTR